MESIEVTPGFRFRDRSPEPMEEAEGHVGEVPFSGVLEVYVHHARNIHNICIYDDQDVYAKFSLTHLPDEAISTRVARSGGRNPDFHELLRVRVSRPDSVLKCEIWMLSRARDCLEDQLLGFALVPLSSVAGEGKGTPQDFTLSSTDLFHIPAGTVRLTLSLSTSIPTDSTDGTLAAAPTSSIASEVVLLDPGEFVSVEFPDIGTTRETPEHGFPVLRLGGGTRLFLEARQPCGFAPCGRPIHHLAAASPSMEDYDMTADSGEENSGELASPDGSSVRNSGVFGFTTTSPSEDRDTSEKKTPDFANGSQPAATRRSETPPGTPTSKAAAGAEGDGRDSRVSKSERAEGAENSSSAGAAAGAAMEEMGSVFKSPLGSINLEEEQSAMQRQIVDMYMRSMQQFTDSLARMELPMELGRPKKDEGGDVVQTRSSNPDEEGKKKDGSRVFYGSRAFF
ncbi:hypothetical protein Taro_010326 [Colocasia esculenta]|uniref:C2 domain-containing protein n=1 Tax=Colocasia esculenta TaxID=4460 RepID=A0A843U7Y9_COLES|nr:hypothetical protein [Colocasia esculenta]